MSVDKTKKFSEKLIKNNNCLVHLNKYCKKIQLKEKEQL